MEETSDFKKELKAIDDRIGELTEKIELGKAFVRLSDESQDFQNVIMDSYLEKESERLFGLLVTPSALKRDQMENISDKLAAIRNIKQFFGTVLIEANMAQEQIDEENDFRQELTLRNAKGNDDG